MNRVGHGVLHLVRSRRFYPEAYKRANPNLWPEAFSNEEGNRPNAQDWEIGAAPHIMVPKN